MKISDIMTRDVAYIHADTPLKQAAETMKRLDTGFLPIANSPQDKLLGVVTDRDIAIRGVAKGLDSENTPVQQVITDKVLYCYEDDSAEQAARKMGEQEVYRLVVLDNSNNKHLCGVVTLADISRAGNVSAAGRTATKISA